MSNRHRQALEPNPKANYFYNMLYRLSICVLPLVVTPYVARVLGTDGNGLYSLSSAVACYFILFSKLGLDNYGSRSIAEAPEQDRARVFWSIYCLQLLTSLLSIAAYLSLIHTFFRQDLHIYHMQFLYVLSALFDVSWFFYGIERFRLTTIRSLLIRALVIIGVFLFVHEQEDLWVYTLIMSACFLLEQLLLFPFVFRYAKPVRVSWQEIRVHIAPNLKLFVPLAALSIYNWMDKLMLGLISGKEPVAYYTYAESIINLPKGIIAALGTVMLPRVTRMATAGRLDVCRDNLQSAVKLICFLCCVLCFGIAGVAPVFIPFFLGDAYLPAVALTVGLAVVMIPLSLIDVVQTQYLVPLKKDRIYIVSVLAGAAVNLILNSAFIPPFAAAGAVIGTIGAELTVCIYQFYKIRRDYSFRLLLHALWPFCLCGVLEFASVRFLGKLPMSPLPLLLLQLAVGGTVYLAAYALLSHTVRKDLIALLSFLSAEPKSAAQGSEGQP